MLKDLIQYGLAELGAKYGVSTAFPPNTFYIAVNGVCNLHCKTCDVGQRNRDTQFYENMAPGTELELATLKKLVDEVKIFRPTIAVTSTEPLLYKDLLPFAQYVKDAGLKLQVTTNGYLLKEFAKDFVRIGVDSVWVSIDGTPAVHNMIRGKSDSYERAMEGIEYLGLVKANQFGNGSRFKSPQINFNYTISDHNYTDLIGFLNGLNSVHHRLMNVMFSHLNYVTPEVAALHNQKFGTVYPATESCISGVDPKAVNVDLLFEQVSEIKNAIGYWISSNVVPDMGYMEMDYYYNHPEKFIPGHSRCKAPWKVAQVFADGSVGVSTRCYKLSFGNIHDEKLMDIWNGEKFKKFRSDLSANGGSFPACSRCCGVF